MMDNLKLAIEKIFKGAIKSFSRFPASIVSAVVISITAIIRIRMDWEVQEVYDFLFNSIQLSFLLGAVFSMAAVVWSEIRSDKKDSLFVIANISGIIVSLISFLFLYFFGGKTSETGVLYLSSIAAARMTVSIFISIVAFIYLISKSKVVDSFSDSFFISHKAFIISDIYGLVIMAGVSGVLGAFQALVYRGLSNNIYQYLAVAVGFLTYTIFLGYFPSFKDTEDTDQIRIIKEQPRFIFVLFSYILVPIIIALTVVLLLWSLRVVISRADVSFTRLSSIASTYVIVGIWLHIMVAKHHTKISEFYKKAYPFAGILILIFEAWALYVQLNKFGLKTAEYSFTMIWIFAVISLILLILLQEKSYRKIAITAVIISIIWVLPVIGYEDITFSSQVKRLEIILSEEGFLKEDNIIIAKDEVEKIKKGEITDAVDFISASEKSNKPNWFKKDLDDDLVFEKTFGFEKTYGLYPEEGDYMGSNFTLKTELIDISDYSFSLNVNLNEKSDASANFEGEDGNYEIIWDNKNLGAPKVTVKLDENIIIEEDLESYLLALLDKYTQNNGMQTELPIEDMSLILEGGNLEVLLVFENIDAYYDEYRDENSYYINPQGIYIKYR